MAHPRAPTARGKGGLRRIFTYDIDKTKRLYAVTLQTLINCLGQFTPGFFDLIIFDEDESGQLPGKTIVFAMTQDHALRLATAFEEMYPQFPGLAQVITYKSEYKGTLIDTFKKESFPRIAISVDMLETGVTAILLSSDTDLIPVIQKVRTLGKAVEYIGFAHRPSLGLQKHASLSRLLIRAEIEPFAMT